MTTKINAAAASRLYREATQENARLRATLAEIKRVAETQEIPDRHGRLHQACSLTCLIECGTLASLTTGKSDG